MKIKISVIVLLMGILVSCKDSSLNDVSESSVVKRSGRSARCAEIVHEPNLITYPSDGSTVRTNMLDLQWNVNLANTDFVQVTFSYWNGSNWEIFYSQLLHNDGGEGNINTPPIGSVQCKVRIETLEGCSYDENTFEYSQD